MIGDELTSGSERTAPHISVIMGVYNAESTVREAIDSIIAQTYEDWEFIICDDGSTDRTLLICQEYAESLPGRIRVFKNVMNLKLGATLNRCLKNSTGSLIARMDADDISSPDRFAKQVALLKSRPEIDLVGTAMRRFDPHGLKGWQLLPEFPNRDVLRHGAPFAHATILARREVFDVTGGYSESRDTWRVEDYDLWFRFFANGFRGYNLSEPLYLVREDIDAFKRRSFSGRLNAFRVGLRGYRLLGFPAHAYLSLFAGLLKGLIPPRILQVIRRWQEKRSGARVG